MEIEVQAITPVDSEDLWLAACSEVPTKGVTLVASTDSALVSATVELPCDVFRHPDSFAEFTESSMWSVVLTASAADEIEPATLSLVFRMTDLPGQQACEDGFEGSDSSEITLQIGINGGSVPRDGEVQPTSLPGEETTETTTKCCYTDDPCQTLGYPFDCFDPIGDGCMEWAGNYECRFCFDQLPDVPQDCFDTTATILSCPTPCPPGQVATAEGCCASSNLAGRTDGCASEEPAECPELLEWRVPTPDFASVEPDSAFDLNPDGSAIPFRRGFCGDPGRPRIAGVEAAGSFYTYCTGEGLDFLTMDGENRPSLVFGEVEGEVDPSCSYRVRVAESNFDGQDSPESLRLRVRERSGSTPEGVVQFEAFELRGQSKGLARASRVAFEVTLVERNPRRVVHDAQDVRVCTIPDGIRSGDVKTLVSGAQARPQPSNPDLQSFQGRGVQEFVTNIEDTCSEPILSKVQEMEARLEAEVASEAFLSWDCGAPRPDDAPRAVFNEVCADSVIDDEERDGLDADVRRRSSTSAPVCRWPRCRTRVPTKRSSRPTSWGSRTPSVGAWTSSVGSPAPTGCPTPVMMGAYRSFARSSKTIRSSRAARLGVDSTFA